MKVYLIYSDSYKRINEKVNEIVNDFSNIIKFDLRINTISDVIQEANYYSLTGEEKIIIVKSNDFFAPKKGKDDKSEDILLKYLNNSNPLVTLIFTSEKPFDKRKKIYKLINENKSVIELMPYNKKEMVYKCTEILKQNKINANYDVCNYIVENSYTNYDICLSEIDKIILYYKSGNLTMDMVKNICSSANNASAFKFSRCILNKDLKGALSLINDFEVLKIDPSIVIISIYKDVQFLYLLKTSKNEKNLCYMFGKEAWQLNDYNNIKDSFKISELKKIIIRLADYDYKYKCGLYQKSVILDLIALEFCE